MNSAPKRSRPLLLFYILFIYVVLQFGWWSYLMVELNNEIYHLKSELNTKNSASPEETSRKGNELERKLHLRWAMTAGEGSVFLVLLVGGVVQTRKAFKKETALTQQQKNFLLSVTHELKSPIASIQLSLETIGRLEKGNEQLKDELLRNAQADTERLHKLVENILLTTRIDSKAFHLHREETDLSAFIAHDMKVPLSLSAEKHRLLMDIEPGLRYAIDRLAFPSVVLNLVENAAKYSPAQSTITVSLHKKGNAILLAVADQGSGISAEERQPVFLKFYRAGNEETRRTKGTGLGLYIVKYLVEQHNGTISIKNNSPAGSVFEVRLPLG